MKKHSLFLLTLAALVVALIQTILYVKAGATVGEPAAAPSEKLARLSNSVSVRAAGRGYPWINLQDGRDLVSARAGAAELLAAQNQAAPLALTSADFDGDGTPDLVTSHAAAQGGILTFYRGNPDAIYPNSPQAKERKAAGSFTDAPFLSPGRLLAVAEPADFIGAGDFDADGHLDIATAARGAGSVQVLLGNGKGSFPLSKQIDLPGRVTTMITGEINRADGLIDIVIAINSKEGARAMIFESISGAINAEPESFALPSEANDFALGDFVDDYAIDLAIVAGGELFIATGRDRHVSRGNAASTKSRARLSRRQLSHAVRAVVTGSFTGKGRSELGLLTDRGEVLALTPGKPKAKSARKKSLDQWKAETLSKQRWPQATRLVRAKVSSLPIDNLLVIDPSASQVHIVTGGDTARQLELDAVSMDVDGSPVAALAMRLNPDALTDLVILRGGESAPSFVTTAPVATFTVVDDGDAGPGTLRQAIIDANNAAGADQIIFMIQTGVQTINLTSALPAITEAVTIDGTSQPGVSGTPLIELNGGGLTIDGLTISGGSSTVRGLAINNLGGNGISLLSAGNNIIEGNFIGLDTTGIQGAGVGGDGVNALDQASVIGGPALSARNIISLTGDDGIEAQNAVVVQGNFIGTDVTGNLSLGGANSGVVINGTGSFIGGSLPGQGNVISGQGNDGIQIPASGNGALILGNFIGTNAAGDNPLGNSNGITIRGGTNCIIGNSTGSNVISGNVNSGIHITSGAVGNLVITNLIGLQANTESPLGNGGDGVLIDGNSNSNVIGGLRGAGNSISFNGGAGVAIASGINNAIIGNGIFQNVGLGIDLSPAGVTPNDAGDGDVGPNQLQNFPDLTLALVSMGNVTIQGTFSSAPNRTYTIDFYASPNCDDFSNGEGQVHIGRAMVSTPAAGPGLIDATFPSSLSPSEVITATATDSDGSTSEFSACVAVVSGDNCVMFDNDSGDGLWETPQNWSTDQVPGSDENACIPSQFTVTISSGNQRVLSLRNEGSLIISGGNLNVNGPSTSNNLAIDPANQLAILAPFSVTGDLNIASGLIVGSGPLTINVGAVMNIEDSASLGGVTVNNLGTVNWTGGGDILIGDDAQFNNFSGGLFHAQSASGSISSAGFMSPGAFNNFGTLRVSDSAGPVRVEDGLIFSNAGIVDVQAGELRFLSGGTNSGNLNVESGATIGFLIGTFTLNPGTTLTGDGAIAVEASLVVNTPITVQNIDVVGALPARPRPGGFIGGGNISGSGNVTVTGVCNFSGGSMSGTGATIINSGAVLNISGNLDKGISQRTINNLGTVNWTGSGAIEFNNGATFNNLAGGLFHAQNGDVIITTASGGGAFSNAGEFRKSTNGGPVNFTTGVPFTNTGLVNVQSGVLGFGGGYTQTAGNLMLNGGNVTTNSGLNIQGGTLSGSGAVNGPVMNGGQVSPGGSPGTIVIAGDYTQTAAGVLNIEIGGLTAGTEHDVLVVNGLATLDGTLNITLINSFLPNIGDTFQVLTYATRSGSFATINGTNLGSGRAFEPVFNANDLTLATVMGAACVVVCPPDLTVNADPTQCGATVSYTLPQQSTDCMNIVCTPPSGALFPVGVTTVNCLPLNGEGCTFNVTVVENAPPQITCPGNITASTTSGSAIVDYVPAQATDNCSGVSLICLPPSGVAFPLGTSTVNCTATDAAGNTAACAFTVTVNDGRAPMITCPPSVIVDAASGQCSAVVEYPPPVVADPTSGATVTCIPPTGSTFPAGTTTVLCRATTPAGVSVTCGFTVTVNTPPLVRVTLDGGGEALQPGPVNPPLRRRNNPPAGCDCDRVFTIENTGCSSITLTLSDIARTGADVQSGRITDANDSGFFSVRLLGPEGSETLLDIGSQVSFDPGQSRSFRLVFNPVVPAFTGRTMNLSASDALPHPTTSRVVFNQGGGTPVSVMIPIRGLVSTDVRLLNPDNPRDNKRVIFTRNGNEFSVSLAVFDSNLDVSSVRYEFLDGQGRVVDQSFDIDITGAIGQSGIIRGQSFKVVQRFTGANSRPQITSVRVTVSDPGSSDAFTAQLQSGTTSSATILASAGGGTILPPPLALGRSER